MWASFYAFIDAWLIISCWFYAPGGDKLTPSGYKDPPPGYFIPHILIQPFLEKVYIKVRFKCIKENYI